MPDLERELRRIAEILQRRGLPYMVIGGIAAQLWGEPRFTKDIDLTVDVRADVDELLRIAEEIGVARPRDPKDFVERTRVLPLVSADGVGVDLTLATLTFEIEAIDRARDVDLGYGPVRFCQPDDLAIMKLVAGRPQDLLDVVAVIKHQEGELDLARVERLIDALSRDLPELDLPGRLRKVRSDAGLDD